MEKHIITWSYWLGLVSLVLAFIARGMNALGVGFLYFSTKGNSIGYNSFLAAAVLFFLTAIATASYSSSTKPRP